MQFFLTYIIILIFNLQTISAYESNKNCIIFNLDTCRFISAVDTIKLNVKPGSNICNAIKEIPCLGNLIWFGNAKARFLIDPNRLELTFNTFDINTGNYVIEALIIEVPNKIGKYILLTKNQNVSSSETAYSIYTRNDDDVLLAYWDVDDSQCNFINIESIDLNENIVIGTFNTSFILKSQSISLPYYSEQINFLNGNFKAKIN